LTRDKRELRITHKIVVECVKSQHQRVAIQR
jgi:hypothetical protein